MNKTIPIAALLALAISMSAAGPAEAGDFQASPVKIHLDGKNRSALVTLVNRGQGILRVQIDAFAWAEDHEGKQVLEPTTGLVVFPTLLELAPGETRAIRVGTTAPPDRRERTYRLLIEELPSEDGSSLGVNLRMRMSLPVFVVEPRARHDLRISPAELSADALGFTLENKGERHIKPQELVVTMRDKGGHELTERVPGWYVLAGQTRRYRLMRTGNTCLERVTIRAESDEHTVERTEAITDPRCAPSQGGE